jgi:3',5'-cyclic AMP phosphodiesterase CpdA
MPLLYQTSTSRRRFLRSALAGGLAIAARQTGAAGPEVRWALLSDTHIPADREMRARGFHIHENLRRTLAQVGDADPAGLLIDGDLARTTGEPEDYEALRQALKPVSRKIPVAMALGNHDDRANFLKAFERNPGEAGHVDKKHVLVLSAGPVRLVLLDSLMYVNQTPGLLGKAQRDWLDGWLRSADNTPVILFVHHTLTDGDGALLDSDRFLNLIKPHRNVKAVFYGHSHRYHYSEFAGIHLVNLPAVGYHFEAEEPVGWVDARFRADGADLTLHAIGGNTAQDGRSKSLRWRG